MIRPLRKLLLARTISTLEARRAFPSRVEHAQVGKIHVFSAFDAPSPAAVHPLAVTGMDIHEEIALLKALMEWSERRVFLVASRPETDWIRPDLGTDGMAAYPRLLPAVDSRRRCLVNAECEAVERHAWGVWWDSNEIGYNASTLDDARRVSGFGPFAALADALTDRLGQGCFHIIRPSLDNSDHSVVIVFFEFQGGGVVSGGACGAGKDEGITLRRALSELFRHGLAAFRFLSGKHEPSDSYEARLYYFASGRGYDSFRRRLSEKGTIPIRLPPWESRTILRHDLESQIAVGRAILEGQRPFLGDDPARLCL